MKKDLSQDLDVVIDAGGKTVTSSAAINGQIIDLIDYNDVMVHAEAGLTAGKIDIKIETASDPAFTENVTELSEDAIKPVVDGDKLVRENKKEAIALYFVSEADKKLSSTFGIIKDVVDYRYIRVTYTPNGSAAAAKGLNSVVVLNRTYSPAYK